jgi:hypothetical protein
MILGCICLLWSFEGGEGTVTVAGVEEGKVRQALT